MTIIFIVHALINKNVTVEDMARWAVAGLAVDAFILALLAFMK